MGCNAKVAWAQLNKMQDLVRTDKKDFAITNIGRDDLITSIDRVGRNVDDLRLFAELAVEHAFRDVLVGSATPIGADICFEFGEDLDGEANMHRLITAVVGYCEMVGVQVGKLHSVSSKQTHVTIAARGIRSARSGVKSTSAGRIFIIGLLGIAKMHSMRTIGDDSIPYPPDVLRIPLIRSLIAEISNHVAEVSDVSGYGVAGVLASFARGHAIGIDVRLDNSLLCDVLAVDIPFDCYSTEYDEENIRFFSSKALKIGTLREMAGPLIALVEESSKDAFILGLTKLGIACWSEIGSYSVGKAGVTIR